MMREGGTQIRTEGWELCRLLPYHLAMPPKGIYYALDSLNWSMVLNG